MLIKSEIFLDRQKCKIELLLLVLFVLCFYAELRASEDSIVVLSPDTVMSDVFKSDFPASSKSYKYFRGLTLSDSNASILPGSVYVRKCGHKAAMIRLTVRTQDNQYRGEYLYSVGRDTTDLLKLNWPTNHDKKLAEYSIQQVCVLVVLTPHENSDSSVILPAAWTTADLSMSDSILVFLQSFGAEISLFVPKHDAPDYENIDLWRSDLTGKERIFDVRQRIPISGNLDYLGTLLAVSRPRTLEREIQVPLCVP